MIEMKSEQEMRQFGEKIGAVLRGGEVIELIGDVGAGKTTLVRGIAAGMGITETVQSPSFTISRQYEVPTGTILVHYDFYRLADPGIMRGEFVETTGRSDMVTVIEWADTVADILPQDRLCLTIVSPTESSRRITISAHGTVSERLAGALV